MQIIPIKDTYSQRFNVQLAGQSCQVALYQKSNGFYCDVYTLNKLIIGGVICQNLNRIVRDAYLGFIGDFTFIDTQGELDPSSPGLGTRFIFAYLEAADLTGLA